MVSKIENEIIIIIVILIAIQSKMDRLFWDDCGNCVGGDTGLTEKLFNGRLRSML